MSIHTSAHVISAGPAGLLLAEALLNQACSTQEAKVGLLTPLKIIDVFICVSATDTRG